MIVRVYFRYMYFIISFDAIENWGGLILGNKLEVLTRPLTRLSCPPLCLSGPPGHSGPPRT